MSYIYRELETNLVSLFSSLSPKGVILTGVVGCGKTTLVKKALQRLALSHEVFSFSGDDTQFRQAVISDSKYIYNQICGVTKKKAFAFVDEVQKCEEIFDAIKYAFDHGEISFIVSGSNPAYLSTVARKRLQRRANLTNMLPISLGELFIHNHWIEENHLDRFKDLLWKTNELNLKTLEVPRITENPAMIRIIDDFFIYGGLPLALSESSQERKLREIQLTVERGFELVSQENSSIAELVRVELAQLQSQEFSYKHILEKTRTRQRDIINEQIDMLINHGYLVKRKPCLLNDNKTSYLSVFSYIDPGIVSYLTGDYTSSAARGSQVEGYIHSRLSYLIKNSPLKSDLGYFKPFTLDSKGNIRYQSGEVDFIFQHGQRTIPIEVKNQSQIQAIETKPILEFMKKFEKRTPFGIILYGGAPYIDRKNCLVYWPYWMV